jgi:lipoprotein NlpD
MKNTSFVVRSSLPVISAVLLLSGVLSGCASKYPAPVDDRSQSSSTAAAKDTYVVKPGDTLYSIARAHGLDHRELIALNNIENANQISVGRVLKVKPKPADTSSEASVSPVTSGEVVSRPIGDEQVVEQKPLDGGSAGANTETLKREPKAGKEKYSDEALARAQSTAQIAPAAAASTAPGEAPPEAKTAEPAAGGDDVGWIWPANGKTIGTFSEGGNKGVDIAGKAGDAVIAAGDGKVVYSGTGLRGYGKLVIIKHNNTYLSAYAHNQNILVKEGQSVTKGQKIAEMGNTDADQVKLHFEVRRSGKPVDPLKYLPQR